jgi:hypothetical protein
MKRIEIDKCELIALICATLALGLLLSVLLNVALLIKMENYV